MPADDLGQPREGLSVIAARSGSKALSEARAGYANAAQAAIQAAHNGMDIESAVTISHIVSASSNAATSPEEIDLKEMSEATEGGWQGYSIYIGTKLVGLGVNKLAPIKIDSNAMDEGIQEAASDAAAEVDAEVEGDIESSFGVLEEFSMEGEE
jgi:hypothetical protein